MFYYFKLNLLIKLLTWFNAENTLRHDEEITIQKAIKIIKEYEEE